MKVNYDKTKELAEKIIKARKKRKFLENGKIEFPDSKIPQGIKKACKDHRLFLFHSVSMDSRNNSDFVYNAMTKLLEEIGTFRRLTNMNRKNLENLLIPHIGQGIQDSTDPIGTLLENAKILEEKYNGDPINIQENDVLTTLKKISKFKQYGMPKASLLMKNLVRFGVWDFHTYEIPIKVDRHVMRISLGNDIIKTENYLEYPNWYGKIPKILKESRDKFIRIGYYSEEDFKEGKVPIIRANKFIKDITLANIKFTQETKESAIDLDDTFYHIGAKWCKANDHRFCYLYCPVNCSKRNPSDNYGTWFFPEIDKRKHKNHLFN